MRAAGKDANPIVAFHSFEEMNIHLFLYVIIEYGYCLLDSETLYKVIIHELDIFYRTFLLYTTNKYQCY